MFDTHAIARALTSADFTPTQADAITDAVRQAAEHDAPGIDPETLATKEDLAALGRATKEDLAAVRQETREDLAALEARVRQAAQADLAALETRIYRAMLVQAGSIVGALVGIAGIVLGAFRLLN